MSKKIRKNKKPLKGKKKSRCHSHPNLKKTAPRPVSLSIDQTYELALQHFQAGDLLQAEKVFQKLLVADPDHADGNNLMGVITLKQEGKHDDAAQYFKKAILSNPAKASFHNNLGYIYKQNGNLKEAVSCYRRGLALTPNDAVIHNNLGNTLQELDRIDEAIASYRKAVTINPDYAEAYSSLGAVLQVSGNLTEAMDSFKLALSLKPDYADASFNLGLLLCAFGKQDESIAYYRKALSLKPDISSAHSNLLLVMNYSPNISQEDIFEESLVFARTHASIKDCSKHVPSQGDFKKRKLRIGYLSPDFRTHSVFYFIEPLLKAHNNGEFEIYCYSDVRNPDNATERLQQEAHHWRAIAWKKDEEVIVQIKNDQIDILVDLAGHTRDNRLCMLASKPAPIQITWLGYPNTTGLKEIDYRFTDAIADPPGKGDDLYSEELIRLEGGFLCYQAHESAPEISAPPCLENNTVTFGSFNNLAKVTPEVINVWSEILLRLPDSRFVLKAKSLTDESTGKIYLEMFAKAGVFSDRIELVGRVSEIDEHLAAYNKIDIALDPFPYNGTTTTCEALWMGVPVVALSGDRHSGRVGASILNAVGLAESLVAENKKSYIEKAVELAKDKELLKNMRKSLRQQMQESQLCDAASFAKKIEEAYWRMWKKYTEKTAKETQEEDRKKNTPVNFSKTNSAAELSLSLDHSYQSAVEYYNAGNLKQAEKLCHQMLRSAPDNTDANHLTGIIVAQYGEELETAIQYIQKALSLEPNNVNIHNSLGFVLQKFNRMEDAVTSYRKAISLNQDYAEGHNNLGNVLQRLNRLDEAIVSYRRALSINPDYVMAHNNLGDALKESGKLEEAIAHYRKALLLQPDFAEAHNGLGVVLQKMNKLDEAIESYRKALFFKPDYPAPHNNLGNVFRDLEKTEESIANYKKALLLQPDYAVAYNNLGVILQEVGRMNEAEESFRKALAIDPDFTEAFSNLGITFKEQCQLDEAISSYRKALALKPDLNLAHSNLIFAMNYSPCITQEEIFEESVKFAESNTKDVKRNEHTPLKRDLNSQKLRIGYVSPDFRNHSVAFFFEPLLKAHNREKFEIYCYADVKKPDEATGRIQEKAQHWRIIAGMQDQEVIDRIIKDRIDILVELTGHTRNNRLLMMTGKPAPIQVSWLGYPNTTGLQEIDYRFTDAIADPVGKDDKYYSEELVRLKDCFLCYQPFEKAPVVASLPCLEHDTVTFGSFNFLTKVTHEVVKVWAKILVQIPKSRLILKAKQLGDESVKTKYLEIFAESGVSVDRIEMFGLIEKRIDHFALYNRIDIALDPFPYNGTTTTCEALWMGVPVVTLSGDRHSGRVGASILHAVGLAESLVADSTSSYIDQAVELASDKIKLAAIRKSLRKQMQDSSLCDAASFAKNIEEAYLQMWAKYTGN